MGKGRLIGILVSVFLWIAAATQAADTSSPDPGTTDPVLMKETVVTASRYQEETAAVPANVTVITREDINNSTATDVPGILQEEVGLHVYDIAGNRRSYRVDRSGFGEGAGLNTLVLVDGRRVNNPDLSGADWFLIPLDRVERIEVIRGSAGSVLYGDNATDSVINIITTEGEGFNAGASAIGGSYNTLGINAYVGGSHKQLSYMVSGRAYRSDGYRDNSDTDSKDAGLNLNYSFGERAKLFFSGGAHADNTRLPGALRFSDIQAGAERTDTTHPDDFADTQDNYLNLNPEIYFLQDSLFKAPVSYRNREIIQFATFAGGEFEGTTETETVAVSPQIVIGESIGNFGNRLTVGVDYSNAKEDIFNRSLFFGFPSTGTFELEKRNYGVYIHDKFFPMPNLSLSAGYRIDTVEYMFSPTAPGTKDSTKFDENPFTAGINWNYTKSSYVYASYAGGFRYPVLDEVFNFFTNTINTSLEPQTSTNYEVGVRHYFIPKLYAHVNFFHIDTKNEIFFNPASFNNENLDAETRREGVELTLGYDFKTVSLTGTYTYRDTRVRGGQFDGNEVPNVPAHQASLNALWYPIEKLGLVLNGIYVGERFFESDFPNAFPKQEDYVVFNGKINYKWQKMTVFMDINNIFDEKYSAYGVLGTFPVEPAVYPSPERNFLVGVRFNY